MSRARRVAPRRARVLCLLVATGLHGRALAADVSSSSIFVSEALSADVSSSSIVVGEALVVGGADWYRSASSLDDVEARLVRGEWAPPGEGDALARGDAHVWTRVSADSAGWIASDSLVDGWAYAAVESEAERTMILEGFGYRTVWVNGEWHSGNIYGSKDVWESWEPRFDFSRVPVRLRRGRNDFLFAGSREGAVKVKLAPPPADAFLNVRDVTLPDLVEGEATDAWAAVVVVCARDQETSGLRLEATVDAEAGPTLASLPTFLPRSLRKVPFRLRAAKAGAAAVHLRLLDGEDRVLDEATLPLATRRPEANRRCTFLSDLDGSVQFFGLLPAQGTHAASAGSATTDSPGPALFLSLHGAGVDAFNQSGSYHAKSWGHVVAPTNRRPFGFNWEDWGRLDALEVLDLATRTLDVDRARVFLTGHSMGGHGTWHLGALFPERFAAIGPSAGWLDFWSYRPERSVAPRDDVERMLMRCTLPSRTLDLADNLAGLGVYVLHGADDDNVPAEQARTMVARLGQRHRDWTYHEEPEAGHWWDKNDEPGVDCVDWAEMFDFFARHARPSGVREVRFLTPNPGLSATNAWVRVEAQIRPLEMSRVDLRMDPASRRFVGTTENVARLTLAAHALEGAGAVTLDLDGVKLESQPDGRGAVTLSRGANGWELGVPAPPEVKGPARYGTFKDVFRHRVLFVYGTSGSREENAWALAKARFDAEQFWYDGNGSIDVVSDVRFDPAAEPDRNVVLYGNASTNRAWKSLLGDGPVRVARGELKVGAKRLRGDDLAALLIRPRPHSDTACVAAVSGTGLVGMRLCDRRPYLAPGFGYPDLTVLRAREPRTSASAAVFAGFFGGDWSVEAGEWAGDAALRP